MPSMEPLIRAPEAGVAPGDRALLAMLALLVGFSLVQLLDYGAGRDQSLYSVVADAVRRGGVPYRDAWDFKPPGIYFVYAAARAVFGPGAHAARILEMLSLLSLIPAFAVFSRRHLGDRRAGAVGAAVAILAYVPLGFWYTGQPEGFGAVLLVWALVCATYEAPPEIGERRGAVRERSAWIVAAALYAMAALLKPPLGGGILVSYALVLRRRRRAPAAGRTAAFGAPTLAFLVGAALPLLATALYFAATGALGDLAEALFVFAPRYTALGLEPTPLLQLVAKTLDGWLLRNAPFNLVGLAALIALPRIHPREREGCVHVLGVIAFSLVGVALQAKFFVYHFAAAYLLTGLLAGWGVWKAWLRVRESPLRVSIAALLLALVASGRVPGLPTFGTFWVRSAERMQSAFDPDRREAVRDRLDSLGDLDARSNRAAAGFIAAHSPADASLFVWGFEPAIYELSGRRPASRYVYNVPQRAAWSMQTSRAILMRELRNDPPAAIVVVHRDRLPHVTGNRGDSFEALRDFAALRSLLAQEYRSVHRVGDLEIHLRNAVPAPTPLSGPR